MGVDLDLFVEQVTWLAPHLADSTRLGVVTWLGRRLEPAARERFARHFPLGHPVQREAEAALCQLLTRTITVQRVSLRATEHVSRAVDWSSTYARAVLPTRPPMPLLESVRQPVPDRACLGALAGLAALWLQLLELADGEHPRVDFAARRAALRRAMAPQVLRGLNHTAFTSRHAQRLRRLDAAGAAAVDSIERALAFWRKSWSESDGASLRTLGRQLDESDLRNVDTLMEATVAISIARAALEAERAHWPTLFPWELLAIDETDGKYPVIRLRSMDLICEIGKGTPRGGLRDGRRQRVKDLLSPWADEVLPFTGRARSAGRQPDLVVSFWLESDPSNVVFALGDAKRNATGDGESYIRDALEVAATYLMSFGYRMGMTLPGLEGGAIRTALMPGVTLFCRQGTGGTPIDAIARLRAGKAPVVMAFDLEKDMCPAERPWRAPVLSAWLGALAGQAHGMLGSHRRHRLVRQRGG